MFIVLFQVIRVPKKDKKCHFGRLRLIIKEKKRNTGSWLGRGEAEAQGGCECHLPRGFLRIFKLKKLTVVIHSSFM